MGKIIRHDFLGNWFVFWLLCVTVIGIPLAVLYLLRCMVTIEEVVEAPSEFLEAHRRKFSS